MIRVLIFAAAWFAVPVAATPLTLDQARWDELSAVNAMVNALPSVHDRDRFGTEEYWEAADARGGDCEDKALAARTALVARRWPADSLRLALAWTETHELHVVLTVDVVRRNQPATYVLDSRFGWVVAWDALTRAGYQWLSRAGEDGRWRALVVAVRP